MSKIDKSVAIEHLKDGSDNLNECMKTIKRVVKSYPTLDEPLSAATEHLKAAQQSLGKAQDDLDKH